MAKEEFLALVDKRYDALQKLNQLDSFYNYEKLFLKLWRDLGREVLEKNLGAVSTNRCKKNFTPLGERLVFISDRATSIRNWIEDTFPRAMSMLDYYHAIQYLYGFAENHFGDHQQGQRWSRKDTQNILNLRVTSMNNQWVKLVNIEFKAVA
ncbi:MAG: hypothetical protein ORN54_03510 [Cyclobacteriaceae bacterium]|nr:hypothetical protein [Cyclobacteriaceae bacterium]